MELELKSILGHSGSGEVEFVDGNKITLPLPIINEGDFIFFLDEKTDQTKKAELMNKYVFKCLKEKYKDNITEDLIKTMHDVNKLLIFDEILKYNIGKLSKKLK